MRSMLYAALLVPALALGGCQNTMKSNDGSVSMAAPKAVNATCPISGLPVSSITTTWHGHTVAFNSDSDARQFDALTEDGQARAMAPTMLARRGVVNRRCPISGDRLTADSPSLDVDGTVVGFATDADLKQWASLPESKHASMLRDMR